jgi:hypothetical protein
MILLGLSAIRCPRHGSEDTAPSMSAVDQQELRVQRTRATTEPLSPSVSSERSNPRTSWAVTAAMGMVPSTGRILVRSTAP